VDSFFRICSNHFQILSSSIGPPLWSSIQSFWLLAQRCGVRFPALPEFSE
jgi:hypothetical protein